MFYSKKYMFMFFLFFSHSLFGISSPNITMKGKKTFSKFLNKMNQRKDIYALDKSDLTSYPIGEQKSSSKDILALEKELPSHLSSIQNMIEINSQNLSGDSHNHANLFLSDIKVGWPNHNESSAIATHVEEENQVIVYISPNISTQIKSFKKKSSFLNGLVLLEYFEAIAKKGLKAQVNISPPSEFKNDKESISHYYVKLQIMAFLLADQMVDLSNPFWVQEMIEGYRFIEKNIGNQNTYYFKENTSNPDFSRRKTMAKNYIDFLEIYTLWKKNFDKHFLTTVKTFKDINKLIDKKVFLNSKGKKISLEEWLYAHLKF
ncbi:hypothetical protein AB834_04740 [PVC group bacterium (ex Bugula neritina AB1)]|nr:hypothetical protein AB834_04740 [PVC group bacterium (ex Bugula neritina AB1)]